MPTVLLADLVSQNRGDLLDRWMEKASADRSAPSAGSPGRGISVFLDELVDVLRHGSAHAQERKASAIQHGRELFTEGCTVEQLVHNYGGVCQAITDLAVDTGVGISPEDFRTLNGCLDDAIADAVAEYAVRQRALTLDEDVHFRNLVHIAVSSLNVIRQGKVGATGATGDLLQRSLLALSDLAKHQSK